MDAVEIAIETCTVAEGAAHTTVAVKLLFIDIGSTGGSSKTREGGQRRRSHNSDCFHSSMDDFSAVRRGGVPQQIHQRLHFLYRFCDT